MQYHNTKAV